MYGRGSQDMKGGVAAMIHAAESVLQRGGLRKGRLIVAAVADEEYASAGADALVARCTADYAVIPEPTDLEVGVAHKGFSAAEIVMHGRAAHGSRPADGRDAILRMGRVLAALELARPTAAGEPPAPAARHRIAARVDHRGWRRAQQLSGVLPPAVRTAHPARRTADGCRGRSAPHSCGSGDRGSRKSPLTSACSSRVRRTRSIRRTRGPHPCSARVPVAAARRTPPVSASGRTPPF